MVTYYCDVEGCIGRTLSTVVEGILVAAGIDEFFPSFFFAAEGNIAAAIRKVQINHAIDDPAFLL